MHNLYRVAKDKSSKEQIDALGCLKDSRHYVVN